MAEREDVYKVELLKGSSNYRTWKFSMKMLLEAKDLWEVVDGSEPRPESAAGRRDESGQEIVLTTAQLNAEKKAQAAWDKVARKAMATIVLGISAEEQENVIDCTTPKEVWDTLEKLYESKGRNRKFMLLQELFRVSMKSGSMNAYLRSIKEKVSELSKIGTKLEKDVKLAIVMNGLPDEYRYLVVALESQDMDKIDFDELTARLLEEEKKLNIGNSQMTALFTRGKSGAGGKSGCHYCGQPGHWKNQCPTRKFREENGLESGGVGAAAKSATFSM